VLKGKGPYIIFILGVIFITYVEYTKPKPLDFTQTYSKNDKIPFGTFALFELLDGIFTKGISVNDSSIYANKTSFIRNIEKNQKSNYFLIANRVTESNLSASESKILLEYVADGNTAFIAANSFRNFVGDSLGIFAVGTLTDLSFAYTKDKVERLELHFIKNDFCIDVESKFVNKSLKIYGEFDIAYDTLATVDEAPVLIKVPHGKGSFIICSAPKFLSNYFLLKKEDEQSYNHLVAENIFRALPNVPSYWDEHYKEKIVDPFKTKSPLSYVLSQRALKWALYTALFTLLTYVFVRSKRLQSIIPIVKPEPNLDFDFAKTIGTLYYHEGNNLDIAQKKILYWKEFIRKKYNLNTNKIDEDFEYKLNAKSKFDAETIYKLLFTIKSIESKTNNISNGALISLNQQLENFYNNA